MKGSIIIRQASDEDSRFAEEISLETEASAILRGSGISKRTPESIIKKIREGNAVIAVTDDNEWAGFSYIQEWAHGEFISNSGLIVAPAYRGFGVAGLIKRKIFKLSKEKYPVAKIFSITTGLAIMKLNARLGFETVTFNELAVEKEFWIGCKSCVNYRILKNKGFTNCLCTSMLYTPFDKSTTLIKVQRVL